MVAVSDSGTGMTPQEAERAFDPFFTTKGVGKGSGLGLSQVFGFVKQSSGHVKIYTELGVGTTIKLYLPQHVQSEAEPTILETASASLICHARGSHEAILAVEDDADVLAYSAEALQGLGYHVIGVSDASSALTILETRPEVSLLFTDVELPGLNGQELAEEVRRRRPDIAVLYTTGYTANAIVHRDILERGARALTKPYTLTQLAVTVRELLILRMLRSALRPGLQH